MKTVNVPTAPPLPETAPTPAADLENASPETIRDEIARTRAHMDENLSLLGRKIKPRMRSEYWRYPLAVLAALIAGYAAFRIARRSSRPKPGPTVTRFKVRTSGMLDHIRTLQLAASVVRKGKPAILIVEPRKT